MSTWPTHPDGTNKRIGDMTAEERAPLLTAASARSKALRSRDHAESSIDEDTQELLVFGNLLASASPDLRAEIIDALDEACIRAGCPPVRRPA